MTTPTEEQEELVLLQARVPRSLANAVAHVAIEWGTFRNRAVAILLEAALAELERTDPAGKRT